METQEKKDKFIASLERLTPIQVEVLAGIVEKFTDEQKHELLRTDFIDANAFEYFSMRLAAHHASSAVALKKENFEHILEQSFCRSGRTVKRTDSMVHRGADLEVDGRFYSLKTEASAGISRRSITISKLMEARWIRDLTGPDDAAEQAKRHVLSHLQEYERIFMLRSYGIDDRIRYDLVEIPKEILALVEGLGGRDFGALTGSGGTSAKVFLDGRAAFTLRLDGSVEKVTISGLDIRLCPLHAWWELGRPG